MLRDHSSAMNDGDGRERRLERHWNILKNPMRLFFDVPCDDQSIASKSSDRTKLTSQALSGWYCSLASSSHRSQSKS
ncbi:MAG: hypothetical protein KDB22_18810, partial [Planctomycetales bacterium]|nr:hypothetical protein [Planctomycetales bacterium]